MTDRKPTGNEPESISLSEAAARLGISYDTARKRLKNGSLKGFKDEKGEWRVVLPPDRKPTGSPPEADRNETGAEPEADRKNSGSVVAVLLAEIAFLRSQIEAKDGQLAARDEEIKRAHILLQGEQQRALALAGPSPRRPWWRRFFGNE